MSALTNASNVVSFAWNHPADTGQRLRPVGPTVAFQASGRLGGSTLARLGEHSELLARTHYTHVSKVAYANPPGYSKMLAWRRHLRPGNLFRDGGANAGVYTFWTAERGAEVISREPDPGAGKQLTGGAAQEYGGTIHRVEQVDGNRMVRTYLYAPNERFVKNTPGHLFSIFTSVVVRIWKVDTHDIDVVSSPTLFAILSAWLISWLCRMPLFTEVWDLWPGTYVKALSGLHHTGEPRGAAQKNSWIKVTRHFDTVQLANNYCVLLGNWLELNANITLPAKPR